MGLHHTRVEWFVKNLMWLTPTWFIRYFIRGFFYLFGTEPKQNAVAKNIAMYNEVKKQRITVDADAANEQHYEVPTDFFLAHLGPRLKYSSCEFERPDGALRTLAEAESFTIAEYQRHCKLAECPDGANVLECGSGWGSLSLANAAQFPQLNFTSFSNSRTQVQHILAEAKKRGLSNISAHVEDYQDFCTTESKLQGRTFSRVFAIETIEHSRNIPGLFEWIRKRMTDDGVMFIQSLVLQHHMKIMDDSDWMGRNFFTGGQVPAMQSYLHYNEHLRCSSMISWSGADYEKTLNAWCETLEEHPELKDLFGQEDYEKFRLFYLISAEAFGSKGGNRYMIGYYVMEPTKPIGNR